jgi:hypothetical protein
MEYLWSDTEKQTLKSNLKESLEVLIFLLRPRTPGAIVNKLKYEMKANPGEYEKGRVLQLYRDFHKRWRRNLPPSRRRVPYIKWDLEPEKTQLLQEKHNSENLDELVKTIGAGPWSIISKIKKEAEKNPIAWDKERADLFNRQFYKNYRSVHATLVHKVNESFLTDSIYGPVLKLESRWTDFDVVALGNSYLNHSWYELQLMFRLKDVPVSTKLIQLYHSEPEAWDFDRVAHLEFEADNKLLNAIKEDTLRNYLPARFVDHNGKPRRRQEVDALLDQGLTMSKIAKQVNESRQNINGYVHSRGLMPYYRYKQRKNSIPELLMTFP